MTDLQKPVPEIVYILHKHRIPFGLIDTVFNFVKDDIEMHTVPYNPNSFNTIDLATSDKTDSEINIKG